MEKIMLVNPPIEWRMSRVGEAIVPPLGLLYVASSLKENGFEVNFLDARALSLDREQTKKLILKKNPSIIGITSMTLNAHIAYDIANDLRKENPNLTIVYGGAHASALPLQVLETCNAIDYAVVKEGEEVMVNLVKALEQKKRIQKIPGIAYRVKGKPKMTSPSCPITDLDKIPFPSRELLPWDKYARVVHRTLFTKKKNTRFTSMITTRGCPFECVYCDKAIFGRNWRARSAKNVLKEIKQVVDTYGVRDITMHDDLFTLDKKRVIQICDGIIEAGWDISWSASARVDTVDKEILEKMYKAGCNNIFYGIESGDMKIINNIRKRITLEQVKSAVKATKEAGIHVTGSFMFGLPGDTRESIQKTIDFAKQINCDIVHFNVTTPFPGSPMYNQLQEEHRILISDWSEYRFHSNEAIFKHENLSQKEISQLVRKAYSSYYLRPSYVAARGMDFFNNPVGFVRAGINLFKIIMNKAS